MMSHISILDWVLLLGIVLLGWFLAVYFKKKYNIFKRDFLIASFFVAGLTAIIIGAYHLLRGMLMLTP